MLNIGLMGTGMVAEHALLKAAVNKPEVHVTAVAARDGDKAARYAERHGIGSSCAGFQALLDRTDGPWNRDCPIQRVSSGRDTLS